MGQDSRKHHLWWATLGQALDAYHAFLLAARTISWIVDFQNPGFFFRNRNSKFLMDRRNGELLCTGRKDGGREIERSEYAAAVEANLKNLQENTDLYKRRQMIIEHIFGTLKRKW